MKRQIPVHAVRRSERVRVFGRGRVCAVEGCDTVLSAYNPFSFCVVHESRESPPRSRRAGSERPSVARLCGSAQCGQVFETSSSKREYCSNRCRLDALQLRNRRTADGGQGSTHDAEEGYVYSGEVVNAMSRLQAHILKISRSRAATAPPRAAGAPMRG